MGIEIERKFLLANDTWRHAIGEGVAIAQGYLNQDPKRTVRVRIKGAQGFITVKGLNQGASRAEYEYPIPVCDAREMLAICDGHIIDKIRYCVVHEGFTWEIDEFLGENLRLIVAEVELESENQHCPTPTWVGKEVTSEPCYYNSNLSHQPYSTWASS